MILLSREEQPSTDSAIRFCRWDARTLGAWTEELEASGAVINLAGAAIADKRWGEKQKEILRDSRIHATRAIVQAIERAKNKPKVLINASALGYYGDVPEGDVTETSPKGRGFLAELCDQWEKEARVAEKSGVRTVLLRTGIVLGKGGGALSKMIPPFQFFTGGPLGSGRQWVSWIHREDVVGTILFALENDAISGPVNVTAPNPRTMRDFCRDVGKVLNRPSWLPVPAFVLKLMLGEMSEVLLGGQRAIPQKLLAHHYSFRFSDLSAALMDILNTK
jgi:uncharacterized protein (TIGR01777 family)